ncbi:MAG: zinc-finger domain-containing protein [Pseudomonadota bacterium]
MTPDDMPAGEAVVDPAADLGTDLDDAAPAPPRDAPETIYVATRRVACDGGGGALGHPKVYYSLDDGWAVCGYCDRLYVFDPEKAGR